jgi:hypothetical protein
VESLLIDLDSRKTCVSNWRRVNFLSPEFLHHTPFVYPLEFCVLFLQISISQRREHFYSSGVPHPLPIWLWVYLFLVYALFDYMGGVISQKHSVFFFHL